MYKTAVLIVTLPIKHLKAQIPTYLAEINRLVSDVVYIHIQPEAGHSSTGESTTTTTASNTDYQYKLSFVNVTYTSEIRNIIKELYTSSAHYCQNVDIRILLGHFANDPESNLTKYDFKELCDVVLIDRKLGTSNEEPEILTNVSRKFNIKDNAKLCQIVTVEQTDKEESKKDIEEHAKQKVPDDGIQQYPSVVVGGTMDRMHTGHKLLLSESCCLATKKLSVALADGEANSKKILPELMQAVDTRIAVVQQFLQEVKPSLIYNVLPLVDVYGPSLFVLDMEVIVVGLDSGWKKMDMERMKKRFPRITKVHVHVVGLIEDPSHSEYENIKISSSTFRKRLLGTLIHPIQKKSHLASSPYIIGVTGGLASGKSSVCKRLEGLGAKIVDCDRLGDKDTQSSQKEESILKPDMMQLVQQKIEQYKQEGAEIVVLDWPSHLKTGVDSLCHEVWTTIIPRSEALKRLVARHKMTELEAETRLDSQMSNTDRVNQSNVIFCTQWEPEYTQLQVEKAWHHLLGRLPTKLSASVNTNITV